MEGLEKAGYARVLLISFKYRLTIHNFIDPTTKSYSYDLMGDVIQLEAKSGNLTDTIQWADIRIRADVVFIQVIVIRAEKREPEKVQKKIRCRKTTCVTKEAKAKVKLEFPSGCFTGSY